MVGGVNYSGLPPALGTLSQVGMAGAPGAAILREALEGLGMSPAQKEAPRPLLGYLSS